MGISVADYLDERGQRKGAAELLVKIDPGGSRRSELRDRINIAPNTLSARLDEAREAGLVEIEGDEAPGRNTHLYALTPKGARVRNELEEREVDKIYTLLDTYLEQVSDRVEETRKWVEDNPDELADKKTNYNILHYYKTDPADFTEGKDGES